MKFIDFFAGIGGFRRGMELAGHECVGFCEFDKFATASYISMHLLTEEQRKTLEDIPIKKRQKEILKEEYRNMVIENILHRKSYRKISKERYIPMNPKDFYGYRRKTVAVLYERMRLLGVWEE